MADRSRGGGLAGVWRVQSVCQVLGFEDENRNQTLTELLASTSTARELLPRLRRWLLVVLVAT